MEWISVKDRLPEKEDLYFLYCDTEDGYDVGRWDKSLGHFRRCDCCSFMRSASHWIPLPQPPKE